MLRSVLHNRLLLDSRFGSEAFLNRYGLTPPNAPGAVEDRYKAVAVDTRYQRATLSDILRDYNRQIGNDDRALRNCRRLAEPGSAVVVTGQQAGMLSGPLYTIYKIVTAIRLAEQWATMLAAPVVPVFWNATEDHDWSEIASFTLPDRKITMPFPADGYAAEALRLDAACRTTIEQFLASIAMVNQRDEIASLMDFSLVSYGNFSSSFIAKLFAGTGLVVLEPRLLRRDSVEFFQQALVTNSAIHTTLRDVGAQLERDGISPPFMPAVDATGLYWLNAQGLRRRIKTDGTRFLLGDRWLAAEEIVADPALLSTSAYLRPVLQALRLPTLAYVAGPAEYRYHLQIQPLFQLFHVTMPLLVLRNHGTVVTNKEAKLAEQLDLSVEDFFVAPESLSGTTSVPTAHQQSFATARNALAQMIGDLRRQLPDLLSEREEKSATMRLQRELDRLEGRVQREFRRRHDVDHARLHRFYAAILPRGQLQERVINVLYCLQADGLPFIRRLLATLDPFESRHYIIYTDT